MVQGSCLKHNAVVIQKMVTVTLNFKIVFLGCVVYFAWVSSFLVQQVSCWISFGDSLSSAVPQVKPSFLLLHHVHLAYQILARVLFDALLVLFIQVHVHFVIVLGTVLTTVAATL